MLHTFVCLAAGLLVGAALFLLTLPVLAEHSTLWSSALLVILPSALLLALMNHVSGWPALRRATDVALVGVGTCACVLVLDALIRGATPGLPLTPIAALLLATVVVARDRR